MASTQQRKQVTERAKGCCEYCMSQEQFSSSPFSVEHIIPTSKKGANHLNNLALSCQGCNNIKYTKLVGKDPESKKEVNLFHPRKDKWITNFKWNENFTVVIGLTAKGRATIQALKLNRANLINQRVVYHSYGIHPPSHSKI